MKKKYIAAFFPTSGIFHWALCLDFYPLKSRICQSINLLCHHFSLCYAVAWIPEFYSFFSSDNFSLVARLFSRLLVCLLACLLSTFLPLPPSFCCCLCCNTCACALYFQNTRFPNFVRYPRDRTFFFLGFCLSYLFFSTFTLRFSRRFPVFPLLFFPFLVCWTCVWECRILWVGTECQWQEELIWRPMLTN